jgi:hypothetical protein
MWCRRFSLLFVALFLVPAALAAQTVRGHLVEEGTGLPIDGALLVLLDVDGGQRAGSLSNPAGRFEIQAPAAGRYRLRAERIGYRSVVSEPLVLAAGQVLDFRLVVPAVAIAIEGIAVEARRRCFMRPQDGMLVATLWEEARKALNAAAWTERQNLVRFRAIRYERELDPRGMRVTSEQSRSWWGSRITPFRSLPVDDLLRNGYVRNEEGVLHFYAPDAEVLLSDAFLDHYCFRVVEQTDGLVGVGFEPAGRRSVPDVRGTLWIDRATAELRRLEYGYVRAPAGSGAERAGGEVEFRRLPTGAWIIERWSIRMPQLAEQLQRSGTAVITRNVVTSIREEGGQVVEIHGAGGEQLAQAQRAVLEGVVWDSLALAPLQGATVFLDGTGYRAHTDSEGRFRLDDLPAGRYHVSFLHARLDSLDLLPPRREVALGAGSPTEVELAVPSHLGILASRCEALQRTLGTGAVVGVVRDETTGTPLPGIDVVVSWQGGRATVTTDAQGGYRMCMAPLGVALAVEPRLPGGYELRQGTSRPPRAIGPEPAGADGVGGVLAAEFGLVPRAIELPGLTATATALSNVDRMRRQLGTRLDLFTRQDLDEMERSAHHVGDVVRRFPSVNVREVVDGAGVRHGLCIESTRSVPVQPAPACRPVKVYFDDMHVMDGGEFLVGLPVSQIESVQYIPGGLAMSRYGSGAEYGVLLVYSRGSGPTVGSLR